jgi:hypothetical protein
VNKRGHHESLQPQQFGNQNAVRHGVFSRRALQPRAEEIAADLLAAGHTAPLDRLAAEEIGSLIALVEAIDADLAQNGLTRKKTGQARSLLELRIRLSGRLQRWLESFGATPASRLQWIDGEARAQAVVETLRQQTSEGSRLLQEARERGAVADADTDASAAEGERS